MKTTVDLPANLLDEARDAAQRRGWTIRVVFEESLRAFLEADARQAKAAPLRLRHTIVKGTAVPEMTFAEMLEASGIDRGPA
jgi:hypothetical protein